MLKRKVFIVDDSPFMRKFLAQVLESDKRLEVVGFARNGQEAIEKIAELKPDVITLDVEMPKLDGLSTLKLIMKDYSIPVVMVSSHTKEGANITFDCLEAGAVDFMVKPDADDPSSREKQRNELIKKVISASSIHIHKETQKDTIQAGDNLSLEENKNISNHLQLKNEDVIYKDAIAIGASTGGPKNLTRVIPRLPKNINAHIFIAQHMPEFFTKSFAERLNSLSEVTVKEAENGETVETGIVYLAKGGLHMRIVKNPGKNNAIIRLEDKPNDDTLYVPSVDIMMTSVANVYKSRSIGVLMTGMGRDGVEGMKMIKKQGGRTIAESEATAVIYGMPGVAVAEGCVDVELPCYNIPGKILEFLKS